VESPLNAAAPDEELAVAIPGIEVAMGADAEPFLKRLLEVRRFVAKDAVHWRTPAAYSWEEVSGAIECLLSAGRVRLAIGPTSSAEAA
jgi:hypothetical protein